jgi:hypothetical protein
MTILEEGKQIRSEVAKLRPDKRRRYRDELRRRILDWVDRAMQTGLMDHECSKAIGVRTLRFTMRRRAKERPAPDETLELVRVEMPQTAMSTITLVAPSGHRVEGLGVEQVAALLRELT